MRTLVSIIVPAYNMAEYTVATVGSLLGQKYGQCEIIVVDDGSTDETRNMLRPFRKKIRYIYQKNKGACSARNRGYRESNGDLVAFLDCDDLYHPDKIARFVSSFERNPEVMMVYSPEYLIDGHDRIIGINTPFGRHSGRVFPALIRSNFIGSSTPVVRREALEKVGVWDETIFTTADWELWLRISREFETGYVEEPLSYSRQVSCYNRRNIERTRREAYYVLDKLKRTGVDTGSLRVSKSNIDLLLHRYAFDSGNYREALKYLVCALRARPVQLEGYLLLLLSSLLRPFYRSIRGWRAVRGVDGLGDQVRVERSTR